jgi:hypothetical protein
MTSEFVRGSATMTGPARPLSGNAYRSRNGASFNLTVHEEPGGRGPPRHWGAPSWWPIPASSHVPARHAPALGEHTDAVLHDLGYAPTEIAALRESGVVR